MKTILPFWGFVLFGAAFFLPPDSRLGAAEKVAFKRTQIDPVFRSEGVAVADFNGDGKKDIAAGSVYYAGPDWAMHAVLEQPNAFSPDQYSDVFACFVADVNGDGRTDLITVGVPGGETFWFENPGSSGGPWKRRVAAAVTNNESPIWTDLTGDGRAELVFGYSPDPENPDCPQRRMAYAGPGKTWSGAWPIRAFSEPEAPGSKKYAHGLGVGDLNGDGRNDVVTTEGWWERPADGNGETWPFHAARLGDESAHMAIEDFDGDGDRDVLSSSAHGFGIWWHEQTADGWAAHTIDDTVSQTHALCLADINGDGLMDFVTGKRWRAHMTGDPGGDMPAVVVWYELGRKEGRPTWTRHAVDHDSGVGTQFEVADVNGDGLLDIVTSNKKGVFYFEQVRQQ
ncbi:MAG: VCBS repeat-containing protein [Pirellulales bacterium]|nr:VCBS repeat-containing protein [Pirellulales bacterium]